MEKIFQKALSIFLAVSMIGSPLVFAETSALELDTAEAWEDVEVSESTEVLEHVELPEEDTLQQPATEEAKTEDSLTEEQDDESVVLAVETEDEAIDEITIANAREALNDTVVAVNGIATKSADGYWYIQDTEAGIAISTTASLSAGNVVKVSGAVRSFDNLKYIEAASVEVLSEGTGMPAPVEATVKDIYSGKYQGMLVSIIGSKIVSMDAENLTIRDDNEATVIQVFYSSELNNGLMIDAKVDVTAIATARTYDHILRMTEKNNMTISVVPSEISSEEELDAIRNNVYGNYILTKNIELTKYWVPLGTAERPFYGKLDGNGYTVSGMDIQRDLEYWYQYAGFMGYMGDGASISNITVVAKDGGSVKAKTQSGSTYAGGIVGYGKNITVDNCVYSGVVEGANYAGYIIGCAEGNSTVKNCKNIEIADGSTIFGGIAGTFYGTIENCSVISGKINAGTYNKNVGGIVGYLSGTMTECFVTAESVTGASSTSGAVGGAVGYAAQGTVISDCYSTAKVTGANVDTNFGRYGTGGFVGFADKDGSITSCYATGDVKGKWFTGGFAGSKRCTVSNCYATGYVEGTQNVGGFCGAYSGTTTDCYAKGDVKAIIVDNYGNGAGGFGGYVWEGVTENCYAEGDVSGGNHVGGFSGYTLGSDYTRCHSTGDVKGTSCVGGFVGNTNNYEYPNGYYVRRNANISECYAVSDVYGTSYVGGFVGGMDSDNTYYTSFNNCYTYDGVVYGTSYTGGFAGNVPNLAKIAYCYSDNRLVFDSSKGFAGHYYNTNGITRCYFNKEINPRHTDDGAAGKTTQQLTERATYLDWDFLNTWEIDKSFNNGLPYVRSLKSGMNPEIEYVDISTEEELNNIRYDVRKNYRLIKDIELTEGWVPVESFYGIFDGNGFSIQNLTLADIAEYSYEYGGLFGKLENGAIVRNLTVKGDISYSYGTGAIIAAENYGKITDCHVIGTVDAVDAGGIVGMNYGYIANSDANVTVNGENQAGGFVCVNNSGNIENCQAKGIVTGKTATAAGGFAAAAYGNSSFYDCHSVCDVTGKDYTGGFIGKLEAVSTQIRSSSSEGKIVGVSNVGGFIGRFYNNSGKRTAKIYDSFSKGSVYASGDRAGGFIGGINVQNSQELYMYIYNSYTTANVRGVNRVGGFVGSVEDHCRLYVYDSYAADGKLVGSSYVGGFLGYRYEYDHDKCVAKFVRCLSRSYLSANASSYAFSHNMASLERCYYDSERSLITDASAVGKTGIQLKDSATYLDWDFSNVWGTSEEINGGYPYLRSIEDFSGEDAEYTLITNEQDLINIRYNPEGKFRLANDITLSYNWIPIGSGTDTNTFNGVLDGDGYTIYGFNVPCDEEYEFEFAAMFASISPKAVIENLNIVCLEDGGVKTKNFGSTNKYAAGIVVNNYGTIRNCSFTGSVSSEYYSGGIVANNYNTIEDCRVNASIVGRRSAGGIAATNAARIVSCSFTGNLTGNGWNIGECFTGGIVAQNSNHVSYCEVKNATINGYDTTGGIAGSSNNNIYNCSVSETLINQNTSNTDAETGGIVGYNLSRIIGCSVTDCTITGNGQEVGGIAGETRSVISGCSVDADISGAKYVGGVAGYLYTGTIKDTTADVHVKGSGDCVGGAVGGTEQSYETLTIINIKVSGMVEGSNYVGGLLGKGYNGGSEARTITDCHSFADVHGVTFVGGLIGDAWEYGYEQATVTNCSASGNVSGTGTSVGGLIGRNQAVVTNCYATGSVNGIGAVGGLIGYNRLGAVYTSYARGDVFGSNNVGGLIGNNAAPVQYTYSTGFVAGETNVGGLVGVNTNSVLNSYYDKEASGQNDTGKGIPKATFELMQQMNYVSWDFDNVWTRRDNYNDGYAYLTSLAPAEDAEKVVIEISSEEDLRNVANNLKGDYILTDDITLTDDWTPIGSYEHTFKGTFDGNGFEISGVSIPDNGYAYVGFFGVVGGGAHISNLTINIADDSAINAVSTNSFAGGLVGYNMGRITSCFVNGTVSGQGAAGGLVGKNEGVITYSASSGAVNGITNVGGFVALNNLSVTRSYSSSVVAGTVNVGGFAGNNAGNIATSYATGNVILRDEMGGGFVGRNAGTVSGCSASNNVNPAVGYTVEYVGGFVGCNIGSGAVIKNSSASSVVAGASYVGGFVGDNRDSASINNCYASGAVNTSSNYNGGFVGRNYNKSTIKNCYTCASVTGTTSNRGGFSGYNGGTVTDCYFDATITGFTTTSGGASRTTTQMFTPSNYLGWDFDSVWKFDENIPGYPYLAWQTEQGQAPSVVPAINITVNAPKNEISVGEAITLTATLLPVSATDNIYWSSSDATTVSVSASGVIIGMKAGKATITAKAGNVEAGIEITVADKQLSGNIIKINTISDIHIPFGSTKNDAEAVLPGTVSVVLDNATLVSLPVSWTLVSGTEYEFEGVVVLGESITNTNALKANVRIIVDEELRAPANITAVSGFELSVSYGTVIESVLAALPERVEVTLSDNTVETLMVSWNSYSQPEFNPYSAGEYVISGTLVLPNNGTVVNPGNVAAEAYIIVEPMQEKARNITGAVAMDRIEVAYGTELTSVKDILPANAYAVVEGPVTMLLPVSWSASSIPAYDKYVAGDYLFTGTFLMPDDGKVTNTSDIKTTIIVTILPSDRDTKTIYVSETMAEIGGIADVTVSVGKDSEIAAGSFCIAFDNSKLTPVGYKVGELIEASSVMVNLNYINPETSERSVKVSFIGNEPVVNAGELITVSYLVNSGVEDNTAIPVSVENAVITDIDEIPLPVTTSSGIINAVKIVVGDVNGDKVVNIMDAFKIMRYDVGFITLTEREMLAADVDKNGEIDIFDALKIQKYDIGLSDSLTD